MFLPANRGRLPALIKLVLAVCLAASVALPLLFPEKLAVLGKFFSEHKSALSDTASSDAARMGPSAPGPTRPAAGDKKLKK